MVFEQNETLTESTNVYFTDEMFNSIISYVNSITIIVSIIFILGVLFNVISIIAIIKSKKIEPISLLLLNLALADLVYIGGIPLFVVHVFSQSWPFDLIGCQLFFLTDFIGMIVGVYTVAALSVERYIEVTDKKKRLENYSNKIKVAVISIYLALIWIMGFAFSMQVVLSIELYQSADETYSCDTQWNENKMNTLFFIKFLFIFFIPFSIISFSSIKLLIFLKNTRRQSIVGVKIKHECNDCHHNSSLSFNSVIHIKETRKVSNTGVNSAVRQKAIKIVLSIIFLFFLQWTPLWIGEVYKATTIQVNEYIQIWNILTALISYSNSISNPLLYIFLTHKFPFAHNIWKNLCNLKKNIFKNVLPTAI